MRGLIRLIVILIVLVAGYWAYYVFAAADPNDKIGVMINQYLPVQAQEYACNNLKERFGDINAPEGCSKFAAWAPTTTPAPTSTTP